MAQQDIRTARRLHAPFTAQENEDDLSSNGHRQLLGVLGIAMPLMVYLTSGWRPLKDPSERWCLLDSISGYYHTGAEAVFIGIVVALGLFLITYDGYANETGWKDRRAARIAGIGALVLAFYPTAAEGHYPEPDWWQVHMRYAHLAGAATLFISFAYMSYFLFPISDAELSRDKKNRNALHRFCGVVIAVCLVWAGIAGLVLERPIFWPETIMLLAFGMSWLVKGKVVETGHKLTRRAMEVFGAE